MTFQLFDTHTHFDVPDFDTDRKALAEQALEVGVQKLILIGFLAERFEPLLKCHHYLSELPKAPTSYFAPGLHPFYIEQHKPDDLEYLEHLLKTQSCVAIGEIGLDTFLKQHKQPELYAKQQDYFVRQLKLATKYHRPVLLHIRKAHADVIKLLKAEQFKQGGIAHAFSGGVQEAKALIELGFKIGVTGQITNPNAKKLHRVVNEVGIAHLVLETDCPDMTPLCCQTSQEARTRNTPVNLPYVLEGLAKSLNLPIDQVAKHCWQNSIETLKLNWTQLSALNL